MLSLYLAMKVATTQADIVRYAAAKGVNVTTATPAAVVTPAKENWFKAWIDSVGAGPRPEHNDHDHFHEHDHDHTHHSQSDPR